MATEDFMSGIETGDFDDSTVLSGSPVIESADPISGAFSLTCSGTNTGTARQWPFTVTMTVNVGNTGQGRTRFRFRINSSLPSDDTPFCGFGSIDSQTIARGEIKSTGEFRVNTGSGGVGSYSTAQLAVDTVYIAELRINIQNNMVDPDTVTGQVSIYTNAGVLIETVNDSGDAANLDTSIKALFLGWASAGSKTANFTFDDLVIRANTAAAVILPATRTHEIALAAINGAGATTDWTGTFADVDEIPFNAADTDEQTTATINKIELYTHPTTANLFAASIEGVKVSGLVISSVSQTHAMLIGATEYNSTWATSYGATKVGVDLSTFSDATFDALEFGVKNLTGTATTTANAVAMQILAAITRPVGFSQFF